MKNNRNSIKVGKNSMSYNDKHRSPPVPMRPIKSALKHLAFGSEIYGSVLSLKNLAKPLMMERLRMMGIK
jgi:hypothetical protein